MGFSGAYLNLTCFGERNMFIVDDLLGFSVEFYCVQIGKLPADSKRGKQRMKFYLY